MVNKIVNILRFQTWLTPKLNLHKILIKCSTHKLWITCSLVSLNMNAFLNNITKPYPTNFSCNEVFMRADMFEDDMVKCLALASSIIGRVTRSGNLLDFGRLFKAFGNN